MPSAPVPFPPLDRVQGQPRALEALKGALRHHKLAHAYLFSGPDGVGKELTARAFAQALTCSERPDEGCGVCTGCGRVERGNHPDVFFVLAEADQVARGMAGRSDFGHTPSRDIRVEQVRALRDQLMRRPLEAARKVVLMLGADRLNDPAQNAFLKTLEEPPSDTVLVLVSAAPHLLLPTIRSRVVRIAFGPLSERWVADRLAKEGNAPDAAEEIAHLAQGSAGAALAMDPKRLQERARVVRAFEALGPPGSLGASGFNDARPLLRFAEAEGGSREDAEAALRALLAWNADVAQVQANGIPVPGALGEVAREAARREAPERLQLRHRLLARALENVTERNAAPRLQLEAALLELFP